MKTRTTDQSPWRVEATATLEGGVTVQVTVASARSAKDAVARAEAWARSAVDTGLHLANGSFVPWKQVLSVHLDPVQAGTGKTFVRARSKTTKVAA